MFYHRLEEIENRLVKNERRTDKELRKLNLKRQKEEGKGSRHGSEKSVNKLPSTFAGLKRSATDFFRLKNRHPPDATQVANKAEKRIPSEPSSQECCGQTEQSVSPCNRQPAVQRLHKSSSSVLMKAATGIPARK